MLFPEWLGPFVLVPAAIIYRPWSVITYMFLHADLWHLFFNMLALFFFGPRLEARLGSRSFLFLYFVSGITAAVVSIPFTPNVPIIGASGAVFGVLLGFARYWPKALIYIWGVIPIQARWLVAILAVMSLWFGSTGSNAGIAHFTHLGGFLGGFLYLKWAEWRSPARQFQRKARAATPRRSGVTDLKRWRSISRDDIHPVNREELDRILDKISAHGLDSLTPDERAFLERFATKN
jgi:membrane associated rhomboid family serine protease